MSGANTNNRISRKSFIAQVAAFTLLPLACKSKYTHIKGSILGANATKGHQLRREIPQLPLTKSAKKVVIIGGGVSGLSAARQLQKNGVTDIVVLEMNDTPGGNSLSGKNEITAYPWGAHYLPIPDCADKELLSFLHSCGVITGFNKKGLPIYNEEYLCFDPEERLFINGYWQEGLIPKFGVPLAEQAQIKRFLSEMDNYRKAIGNDGKDAFCIPVNKCSNDYTYKRYDEITFEQYLKQNNYNSTHLIWYLNYCTKDDFGAGIDKVSAWAGIHYFAARKGKADNASHDDVLTWPEGNNWLVNQLQKGLESQIIINALTYSVKQNQKEKIEVTYLNGDDAHLIEADVVVLATPNFINKHIVEQELLAHQQLNANAMPWMVANITVKRFFEYAKGLPLSWDNVIYGNAGLGYINATQQHLNQPSDKNVLTFYYPFCNKSAAEERQRALGLSHKDWVEIIMKELERAHLDIVNHIEQIDVWVWGHGMVLPEPGYQKKLASLQPAHHRIKYAHTDFSGISIFEEAFHQGINAANEIIKQYGANV